MYEALMYETQYRNYSPDLRMYESLLDKNIPVVEFGSGTGRISLNLLKKGYTVFGIEKNDSYREFFTERIKKEKFSSKFTYIRDVRAVSFPCSIIYPFNVLFYLTEKELIEELEKLKTVTFNLVIFETDNIHKIDESSLTEKQHKIGEFLFNEKPKLGKSRITIENRVLKNSKLTEKFRYHLYLHKAKTLLDLYVRNFSEIRLYGDFSMNQYNFNSEKIIAVIKKS